MTTNQKEIVQYGSAVGMLIAGVAFCAWSSVCPPAGVVDSSALLLLGQCIVFAGSVYGIKTYVDATINAKLKER